MKRQEARSFLHITLADFIVRSAYQMGKTPLLPIFAAALGASDVLLGTIVAVSTFTGMVTKPLFGLLSDRMGRRLWIVIGTLLFTGIPFLYRFIETPGQLVVLRLIHGTATAIYGPVTVAYVAERGGRRKAERLGWFSMARSGGYIVGPAVAGWLLLWMGPVAVFTAIGLISAVAFIPVSLLTDDGQTTNDDLRARHPLRITFYALHTPAVWLSGGMEATVYVATYALRAFLPIYALTAGYSTAQIGLFFSVQEFSQILLKPAGGHIGDRYGHLPAVALGMAGLAVTLPLLPLAKGVVALLSLSAMMGAAQALVFPGTLALVAEQIAAGRLGAGMGTVGTLKNMGKIAGPILGGMLIAGLGYRGMFWLLAGLLLVGALLVVSLMPRRVRALPTSVATRDD